ncbi:Hypothetical_protein [Hexamita inflata]|uniref:Hypothetical_protein n=1 Tax=Hexamita inflata TaxID=28002 RepID=A0AA86R7C6_9EUKA|nr:Hypothetical protein HINF_LOCUS55102 [Hexamita inflata]
MTTLAKFNLKQIRSVFVHSVYSNTQILCSVTRGTLQCCSLTKYLISFLASYLPYNFQNQMLSSILIFSQLKQKQISDTCNKFLLFDDQQYQFCQKSQHLNKVNVSNVLQLSQQSSHLFIYTDGAVNTQIQTQLSYVNIFAVFGFNIDNEAVLNCTINISINFKVVTAALICLKCNLMIDQCALTFTASGQYLSAVLISTNKTFNLRRSTVEYRFGSTQSSGIVNQINTTTTMFNISKVKLSGFDYINGSLNGYLISEVNAPIKLNISDLTVCASTVRSVGAENSYFTQVGAETIQCSGICPAGQKVTYGLCLSTLLFGELIFSNHTQVCVTPFEYDQEKCVCTEGFFLNVTQVGFFCFDLVQDITTLDVDTISNFTAMDIKLKGNTTNIENRLISNFTQAAQNLSRNTTNLDKGLNANITAFNASHDALTTQQTQNHLDLNNRLAHNVSYIETQLKNNQSDQDAFWQQSINNLNTVFTNSKNFIELQLKNNFSRMMTNLESNTTILDNRNKNNFTTLTNSFNALDAKVNTNQNNLNTANQQQQVYLEGQLNANYTAQTNTLNGLLNGLRTDLTWVDNTKGALIIGMRNDLNYINSNDNALINGQVNNANNAQARINGNVNDINGLKSVDGSLQYQINVLNGRGVPSVTFQYRSLPIGYYGAMVSVLFVCVDSDCRQVG